MIFGNYTRAKIRPAAIPQKMLQHAGDSDACGTFVPANGGPTALVIGARANPLALTNLAKKHGLEPAALTTFARGHGHE